MKTAGAVLAVAVTAAAGSASPPGGADADAVRIRGHGVTARAAPVPTQWCGGTQAIATDRKPDAVTGHQIHVVYAFAADVPDRFAQLASSIASEMAAIDNWWRRQDATRTPRFDLFAFPGCTTAFGQLDITRLPLPQPGSFYGTQNLLAMLANALRDGGLNDPYKKYLMVYDGPVPDTRVCGQSFGAGRFGGAIALAATYLGAVSCPNDLGAGAFQASVLAHELLHNFGAVERSAPNICPDTGHVCDDANDLLFPTTRGQGIDQLQLDIGRNDYYGHTGSWLDTRQSQWMSRLDVPDFPLTITLAGRGTVTADQPGQVCPPQCVAGWDGGTAVTLTATAAAGTTFRGWSGACTGLGPCHVTMDAAKGVTLRFVSPVRVRVRIAGRVGGSVVSRPAVLSCPPACIAVVDSGTRLVLRATPRKDARFAGWSGACRGSRPTCTITPAQNAVVTAIFRLR